MQSIFESINLFNVLVYLKATVIKSIRRMRNGAYLVRYVRNKGNCSLFISREVFKLINRFEMNRMIKRSLQNVCTPHNYSAVSADENSNTNAPVLRYFIQSDFNTGRVRLGTIEVSGENIYVYPDCRKQPIKLKCFSLRIAIIRLFQETTGCGKLKSNTLDYIKNIEL